MNYKYIIRIIIFSIIFLIIGFINESFLCCISFLIIHELAHCFTGVLLGYSVSRIRLLPFGISANFNEEFINPLDDLLISASGPLINFIFFIFFLLFQNKNEYFPILSQFNLILSIFNLLPAGFLDGGRILKNILKIYISFYSAYYINNINGIILGCLLVLASFILKLSYKSIVLILMGMYFIYNGYCSQKEIIINITKDALNKGAYLKNRKVKEKLIFYKNDCKLINVIKCFCFRKNYILYININGKTDIILTENEILKAYFNLGNIMLSELNK